MNNLSYKNLTFKGIIIVLGSTNSNTGELCSVGKERALKAYELWQKNQSYKFILTGGFGDHFNTTSQAHGYYVQKYLLSLGVPASSIYKIVESYNTVDDAFLTKVVLESIFPCPLYLVTSDFHMHRTKFIFEHLFSQVFSPQKFTKISYVPCETVSDYLKKYQKHEDNSMKRFLKAQN